VRSVQSEFRTDRLEFRRLDEARMSHRHRMKQAVELARPEIEELFQLGEMRVKVVVLPDKVLKYAGMIRHAVKDTGSRQPKPFELTAEVGGGHADPPDSQRAMVSPQTQSDNRQFRKKRAKSIC
jgi:hypothetical protein